MRKETRSSYRTILVAIFLANVSVSFGQVVVSERVEPKVMLRIDAGALSDSLANLQLRMDNLQQQAGPAGADGATGPQGPAGPAGVTGPAGADGADGADGSDGSSLLNGAADPTSTDGSDGDFWINTTTWEIFGPKSSSAWPAGVSLVGPAGDAFTCGTNQVTYNGHDYSTVAIGTQCWFAENLRSGNYANGDAIPGDLSNATWESTTTGAQAVYGDDATNLATYGRLYNWHAVDDARGLCPSGWHVPTDDEFTELTTGLGGESVAGSALKASATDSPSWDGSNSSGFSALPGGYRHGTGSFYYVGYDAFFWSSSPSGSDAWSRRLNFGYDGVSRDNYFQRSGFSVRCVRD